MTLTDEQTAVLAPSPAAEPPVHGGAETASSHDDDLSLPAADQPAGPKDDLRVAATVAAVVFLCCVAWMPRVLERLHPLTGDEPFYVMTSISLIEDRDLNEQNNYEQRDFDRFYPDFGPTPDGWPGYPDPLPPHQSQTDIPGVYSKHGLGMAVLIAVPFKLGGRPLILLMLAAIAAALAANMVLLGLIYSSSAALAAAVALALSLTNPLFSFSLLIFPELTAALCITYAARRLFSPMNASWQWLLIGCCAASLPWLHYRLAPVSAILAIIAFARFRRHITQGVIRAFLSPPIVSAAVLFLWYRHLYGGPLPPSSDHAGFSGFAGALNGFVGTFFDQQWGAYIHNPILALATAAFLPFLIWQRRDALALCAIVIPYLVLISSYRVWWGEWNPPARYLTDIVPLAAAPLVWWLGKLGQRLRWAILLMFTVPAVLVMMTFALDPQRMYNHPDGTSNVLETWDQWLNLQLIQGVPSFVFYSASPVGDRQVFGFLGALLLGAVALIAVLLIVQVRQRHPFARAGIEEHSASQ